MHFKDNVLLTIFLLITVCLFNGGCGKDAKSKRAAPEFTLRDLSDQPVSLSQFRGKVVLLDFWATWCPPCRREIPNLIEIKNAFRHRNFEIISIDGFERHGNDRAFRFVREKRMNWIHIIDKQKGKEIARMYGVEYVPATFVIKNGKIVAAGLRGHELKAAIRELVR